MVAKIYFVPGQTFYLPRPKAEVYHFALDKHGTGWKIVMMTLTRQIYEESEAETQPPQTEEPVEGPTEEPTEGAVGQGHTYTAAPTNPEIPEEVVAAFFFLINEGKTAEATKVFKGEVSEEVIKDFVDHCFGRIETIKTKFYEEDNRGAVEAILYGRDGNMIGHPLYVNFQKTGGKWDLD